MRNKLALIGALAFLVAVASTASGQRRLVSTKEFLDSFKEVNRWIDVGPRRWKSTEETINNGVVVKSVVTITEVTGQGHTHSYAKTTQGSEITEAERIWIDPVGYERKDGGPWAKLDSREFGSRQFSPGNGSGSGSSRVTSQCQQFSVESVSLDGRMMQLYEALRVDGLENELQFRNDRSWIGEDGRRYKWEHTSGKLFPHEETSRFTMTITYDVSDVKEVEAPIP